MKKLGNFIKKFVDADTSALLEAGYIAADPSTGVFGLTKEGRWATLEVLFAANKAAVVEHAKEAIAEAEAEAEKKS